MTSPTSKQDAWNKHWKAGHISSLSLGNETTESPEAMAAWDQFFSYFQSGAVILDIATGNGIVPALARGHALANNKTLELIAIDQADIDPEKTLGDNADAVKDVLFIGEVEAEDLPFEDQLFDAITGQYALEYTDTDKSISEVARVLKPNGIIRFVCHAKDGVLVKFNTPKADQCRYILIESGVLEALSTAAKAAFEGAEDAQKLRDQLKAKVEAARSHLKTIGENNELDQFLTTVIEAYIGRDQFGGLEAFEAWISGVRGELEGQILMMEALNDVALTEDELNAIGQKLASAGFQTLNLGRLEVGPNKDLLAYTIEGMKS